VSHKALRKDKECLNCGAEVDERFCPHCGQENVEPHDSFWHMLTHFVFDIFHFDSKFFSSVKLLLTNPGFLPAAYISGKRASYLNPVKMYVFTSAIFFLIFFTFFANTGNFDFRIGDSLTKEQRDAYLSDVKKKLAEEPGNSNLQRLINELEDSASKITKDDVVYITGLKDTAGSRNTLLSYRSVAHYDSVQQQLGPDEKDNWFEQLLTRRGLKLREKYNASSEEIGKVWVSDFMHKLPYLLFLSLPLFALILKILYRRRRELFYVDHGIFAVYQYLLSFVLLFFILCFRRLESVTGLGVFNWLTVIAVFYGGFYLLIALKRFYRQSMSKTFAKFLLLNIGAFVMLIILFVALLIVSFLLI
jgi:hypothetical protein